MPLHKVYSALLDAVFRSSCPRCGSAGAGYCPACRRRFEPIRDPCPRCGLPRPVAHCPRRAGPWRLDAVIAPFVYAAPLGGEIVALKSARERTLGYALGELLADAAEQRGAAIDMLVPVPLHVHRLRARGFNQAVEIARPVAARRRIALQPQAARRERSTRTQTGLDAAARARNLAGSFRVTAHVAERRVAIVDDVLTTGATANALAAALRAAGAARVEAWVLTRTLPERAAQTPRNM